MGACVGSFINVVIYRLPRILEKQWMAECISFLREYLLTSNTNEGSAAQIEVIQNKKTQSKPTIDDKTTDISETEKNFPWLNDTNKQNFSKLLDTVENEYKKIQGSSKFNLIVPRSHCPACKTKIPLYRNIPIFTWLIQRGKAHCCAARISPRYFIVELIATILTVTAVIFFGLTPQGAFAVIFLLMVLALAGIDYETQLLPDTLTLGLMWIGLSINVFGTFVDIGDSVFGAIFGYSILWILYQIHKLISGIEGMGYGDFKITAAFGAWFGWKIIPVVLIIGAISGIVIALLSSRVRKSPRLEPISFGPPLCLGAVISLFYGKDIIGILGY